MEHEQSLTVEVTPGFLVRVSGEARVFIPLTATGETQPALDLTPFELYLSNVAVLPFGTEVDGGTSES